jgi:hypothetical protein
MAILGVGIGFTMQIMVLATQNEAPSADLGVATSTVTFFRSVGGSLGVALFGALFSSRLTDLLGDAAPTGLTPEEIAHLPAGEAAGMATAFADAITGVFRIAVPFLLVGWAITWLLKEVPLRTASGRQAAAADRAGAPVDAVAVDAALAAAGPGTVDAGPGLASRGHGNGHVGRDRDDEGVTVGYNGRQEATAPGGAATPETTGGR